MSIRLLAKDLYELIIKVEKLERELEKASWDKKAPIEEKLRKMRAERDKVRRMLEGRKDVPYKKRGNF